MKCWKMLEVEQEVNAIFLKIVFSSGNEEFEQLKEDFFNFYKKVFYCFAKLQFFIYCKKFQPLLRVQNELAAFRIINDSIKLKHNLQVEAHEHEVLWGEKLLG